MIKIRRGLDLPITGSPEQKTIHDGPAVSTVAVVGPDYHGMKPTMAVQVGDKVKLGQLLFTDKKTADIRYTAPAAGTVTAINRGARRVLQSVVITVEGDESESFEATAADKLSSLAREKVVERINEAGMWVALRTRPYSRVPALDSQPSSIFVTAIDTNPLAADPRTIMAEEGNAEKFRNGLAVLSNLTEGSVYVCKSPGANIPGADVPKVSAKEFAGVHPAGNPSTHIHFIDPVNASKTVWQINYQDVIALGELFVTGTLNPTRVISLAGPQVSRPRLIRTRLGANTQELTAGELRAGENRIISGSVFGGRTAEDNFSFLGRYHSQISVLREGRERDFMHYLRPGADRFSATRAFLSSWLPEKKYAFTTSANGSERAMVPIGTYEKVMPLDILPTQLLRSLIVGDTDEAQKLGCLELEEEDLALCTFVCAGKYEYGPILRDNLTRIEREG